MLSNSNIRVAVYIAAVLIALMPISACAASSAEVNKARIVAIGDVHGDYDQFVTVLQDAGVIDKRKRWAGGTTILVQTGDIPDRGPDTRKIIDLLMKLEKAAKKKGGKVVCLIGNHEAMNIRDDLRYVHPGEYEAFKDRNSRKRQADYLKNTIDYLAKNNSAQEPVVFDQQFKDDWKEKHPLGYVEHRLAWAPGGEYGKWVVSHDAVAIEGDSLFLHGGISPDLPKMPVQEINTRIRTELIDKNPLPESALSESPDGPLWYRGWAVLPETAENEAMLDDILNHYSVSRMVISHTPLMPAVLPRFNGKVLLIDVGLSAHYGSGNSYLTIENGVAYSHINGTKLPVPDSKQTLLEYLNSATTLVDDPSRIIDYIERINAPVENETIHTQTGSVNGGH